MRIARPIAPTVAPFDARVSSFGELAGFADVLRARSAELRSAQNSADIAMASNLRRSRSLARKGS